jgi:hypothetical protein
MYTTAVYGRCPYSARLKIYYGSYSTFIISIIRTLCQITGSARQRYHPIIGVLNGWIHGEYVSP